MFLLTKGVSEKHRIRKRHSFLNRFWIWFRRDQSLFAFYIFGHLSKQERQERHVSEYLKNVMEHFLSLWLYALEKFVGPEDNWERSQWNIELEVTDLAISSSRDRLAVASIEGINV